MQDIGYSTGMAVLVAGVILVYLGRTLVGGRARHARTEADGGSVFLGKPAMEMAYWIFEPVAKALNSIGVTPNMVTAFSLVPALAAGVAAGLGHFGLACVLGTAGALCDLVDGLVARHRHSASQAGEVFDSSVDRYGEYFLMAGLIYYFRWSPVMSVLSLATVIGAFMVSYSTAEAKALRVAPPRGAMRRAERAVYLLVGSGLTPFTMALLPDAPLWLRESPIVAAVAIVGVVANISAVTRLSAIMRALRERAGQEAQAQGDGAGDASALGGIVSKPEKPARVA